MTGLAAASEVGTVDLPAAEAEVREGELLVVVEEVLVFHHPS